MTNNKKSNKWQKCSSRSIFNCIKKCVMFNAQYMCQIICRNVQTLKWRTNFKNISSKFVVTAIYGESSKLTGTVLIFHFNEYLIHSHIMMLHLRDRKSNILVTDHLYIYKLIVEEEGQYKKRFLKFIFFCDDMEIVMIMMTFLKSKSQYGM